MMVSNLVSKQKLARRSFVSTQRVTAQVSSYDMKKV